MKKLALSIILSIITIPFMQAQTAKNVKPATAKLQQAHVYLQGATLTHTASVTLQNGAQEITIEGISPEIDLNSLKVNCAHNGTLLSSIEFSTDYMTIKTESLQIKKLRDSLAVYKKRLQSVNNDISLNKKLMKTLSDGITQNTQQKDKILSMSELTASMELYKAKAPQLQKNIDEGKAQQDKLNEQINRIEKQIKQDESNERKRSGILRLSVTTPIAITEKFTISYYTPKASWSPCYDIHVSSTGEPVILQAKAQVRQTTGLEWSNVKLSLSNARPNTNNIAPLFTAWFLHIQQKPTNKTRSYLYSNSLSNTAPNFTSVKLGKNKVTMEMETDDAAQNNQEPAHTLYMLNGNYISESEFNSIDPSYIESMETLDTKQALEKYGKNAVIHVIQTKSMDDYVELQDSDLDVSFQIALPYTINGNGKAQLIDLKKYEIPSSYHYYAAPKLTEVTYLMATLSQNGQNGLLPGPANINYNNTYVGKTELSGKATDTALTITLAEEPRIMVKREKRIEYSSSKTIGSTITQTRSHLITVKNNMNKSVIYTLKEQYPISTDKEIEVKLLEQTPEASINNSDLGVLTWKIELAPGEIKKFIVTYSVKYPKDSYLELE